jgi:hypothetical protein
MGVVLVDYLEVRPNNPGFTVGNELHRTTMTHLYLLNEE